MVQVLLRTAETGKAAAEQAFSEGLRLLAVPEGAEIAHTVLGKPYLKEYPQIQYNISHSGIYGACAFSDRPVGVDVECFRPVRRLELARRFFTDLEYDYLKDRDEKEFFRLWTRKESYIKAIGKGLRQPLDSFSVLEDILYQGTDAWFFTTLELDNGYLSVCAQEPAVEWKTGQ